ncbi:hypothetical protein F2Q69_00031430 [Brassica cretica]|uniref:Uncharacterized protein n=1 Tax=Brassica cretica TaxID=69181 RepID=A0A8S9S626_BRACR|nr:hypothetical protein F2Q69_00031430 [Brassica cretica]
MDGVPDLSALLKGKLQLLLKKSTPTNVPESTSSEGGRASEGGGASKERVSSLVDECAGAEPSASRPKKKKKSKKAKRKATDEAPLEVTASLDEASEGSEARKKKEGKKRPREGATSSVDQDEAPAGGREGAAEDLVETDPAEAVPEDRPKKKTKKKSVEAEPRPSAVETNLVDVARRDLLLICLREKALVLKKELPQIEDLYFKDEYIDATFVRKQSDGSMNFLVEKYDSTLKQMMVQLGASQKLAQARFKAIERVRAEHKKANDKAAKEKEVLRVKF